MDRAFCVRFYINLYIWMRNSKHRSGSAMDTFAVTGARSQDTQFIFLPKKLVFHMVYIEPEALLNRMVRDCLIISRPLKNCVTNVFFHFTPVKGFNQCIPTSIGFLFLNMKINLADVFITRCNRAIKPSGSPIRSELQ